MGEIELICAMFVPRWCCGGWAQVRARQKELAMVRPSPVDIGRKNSGVGGATSGRRAATQSGKQHSHSDIPGFSKRPANIC
jgi:hypothetical protein